MSKTRKQKKTIITVGGIKYEATIKYKSVNNSYIDPSSDLFSTGYVDALKSEHQTELRKYALVEYEKYEDKKEQLVSQINELKNELRIATAVEKPLM